MSLEFVGITESEFIEKYKFIYRFVPIERLLETLETNNIIFKNPEKWEDPYESYFICAKYIKDGKEYGWPLRKRVFCLCFSKTASSEAFWKGYTPLNDGVRIKIDTKELINELKEKNQKFYVTTVDYKITDDIKEFKQDKEFIKDQILGKTILKKLELLRLKRISFKYEQEVRFAIVLDEPNRDEIFSVEINPGNIFKELLLHPKMGKLHAKILKEHLNIKYKAKHSQLYTTKNVTIKF